MNWNRTKVKNVSEIDKTVKKTMIYVISEKIIDIG